MSEIIGQLVRSKYIFFVVFVFLVVLSLLSARQYTEVVEKEVSSEGQAVLLQKDNFSYLEKNSNLLLLDAIANNDVKTVIEAIEKGADINYRTSTHWIFVDDKRRKVVEDFNGHYNPIPEKYTFIFDEEVDYIKSQYIQSYKEDEDMSEDAKKLFRGESRSDLEGKKVSHLEKNSTPLELASKLGRSLVVGHLLEDGAFYSEEALFAAVRGKYLDVVKELLKQERNLNFISWNDSPLSIAVEKNDEEMSKFLIERGAEISFYLGDDSTSIDAFDVAMRHYNTGIVELFLEYKSLRDLWKRGTPPLHWVIDNNPLGDRYITEYFGKDKDDRVDMLGVLLNSGADINEIYDSKTPLVEAIILWDDEKKVEIVEFLVSQGADVNIKTNYRDNNTYVSGEARYPLDLVNRIISKDTKDDDSEYIRIEKILEQYDAKSLYVPTGQMEAAKKKYDKDLGNGYMQHLSGLELGTGDPKVSIYYHKKWMANPDTPESFLAFNAYYVTDGKKVYFNGKSVSESHLESFEVLEKGYGFYAKDKNSIFSYGIKLVDSDSNVYTFMGDHFVQSNSNVYYQFKKIADADATSFQVIKWPYSKDKNHVYREEKILENEDPKTFKIE